MNSFTNSSSVISSDTVIKGKIDFKGELLIEGKASGDILVDSLTLGPSAKVHGKIIGTLKIAENCTSASLIIKQTGIVEGDVYGSDVIIEGEVVGNVSGKKEIKIENSAFISGNVYYDILDVQGGATINGNLIRNKGKEPQKLENKSSAQIGSIDKKDTNEKLLSHKLLFLTFLL